MTSHELALTEATEQGKRDFDNLGPMPDYGDRDLEQAWSYGYQMARSDYLSFDE